VIAVLAVGAAGLVTVASVFVAWFAVRGALDAHARLATARLELLGLAERVEDAEASETRALELLDRANRLRAEDLRNCRDQIATLREACDQAIRDSRRTHGESWIDQYMARRRVH
jgi:hypothetical protein